MSDHRSADEDGDEGVDEGVDDEIRESRGTGGDAPAAGSIEERETVAEDAADAFDEPRGNGADRGGAEDRDGAEGHEEAGERDDGALREDDPAVGHEAGRPPAEPPD